MSFKTRALSLSIAALLAFSTAACGDWIDGRKKQNEVIELSDDRFDCLNPMPTTIRRFLEGSAKTEELRSTFGCLREAFTYFGERTKGSLPDAYTVEDLRKFFGKYFLKQNNISLELAQGLMTLKRALLGGSDGSLSKAEIGRLVLLLQVLEDESVKLAPHMDILFPTLKIEKTADPQIPRISPERLNVAVAQARSSLLVLLGKIDLSRSDYSYDEAQQLFAGLAAFVAGGEDVPVFNRIETWLPAVESLKIVFFGEQANLRGSREWSAAMETLLNLYDVVLRYHYLLREDVFKNPQSLHGAMSFFDRVLNLLETSHQMRRTGRIPFRQIDTLIDRVFERLNATDLERLARGEEKSLPASLSADGVKSLYQKVVVGMLDPVRRGESRGADAFERAHLLSLRREFNIFRLNQVFLNSLVGQDAAHDKAALARAAEVFPAATWIPKISNDSLEREAMAGAWEKFRQLLLKENSIRFSDSGRVIMAGRHVPASGWIGLTRFNLMYLLARGFMLGYGDDRDPVRAGCDVRALETWYADFQKFGIELKAFDPRSGNSGNRSHKEASFFTFSGNGDERVDLDEMFDFVSFLFSGGMGNAQDLLTVVRSKDGGSCELAEKDVFDLPWMDEGCFKEKLRSQFPASFDNMPDMVRAVGEMNAEEWDSFYLNLMTASRTSAADGLRIETSDVRTAVMILHYTESLFVTFDTNKDDQLSLEEIKAAAPRFISFIKEQKAMEAFQDRSDSFKTWLATQAFVTMVYKSQQPDGKMMASFAGERLGNWMGLSELRSPRRGDVLKVFGNLLQQFKSEKEKSDQTSAAVAR